MFYEKFNFPEIDVIVVYSLSITAFSSSKKYTAIPSLDRIVIIPPIRLLNFFDSFIMKFA